jgi:hypothetical protein
MKSWYLLVRMVVGRPVARQRPRSKHPYNSRCQVMAATGTHATTEELLGVVFSVRPVPRLHNEGPLPSEESLEMAARRVGGGCEMSPACEDVSPGAGERPLVKTQQTEKT